MALLIRMTEKVLRERNSCECKNECLQVGYFLKLDSVFQEGSVSIKIQGSKRGLSSTKTEAAASLFGAAREDFITL